MNERRKMLLGYRGILTFCLIGTAFAVQAANPSLNFTNTVTGWGEASQTGACAAGDVVGCATTAGGIGHRNDLTRFENARVVIDGVEYWHVLVGDPATGFASESYTRTSSIFGLNSALTISSPDGGGNETLTSGAVDAVTAGNGYGIPINQHDPFGVNGGFNTSGNGTQDPRKAAFRMVLTDSEMSMEVIKPLFNYKSKITQTVIDGDFRSEFVTDQRGLTFDEMDTAAPLLNRQAITDPDLPVAGAADFDMTLAERPHVTSGQYIFTPGIGWNTINGWSAPNSVFDEGTYTYIDGGGFDVYGIDWKSYFDFAQNAASCGSPFIPGLVRPFTSPDSC